MYDQPQLCVHQSFYRLDIYAELLPGLIQDLADHGFQAQAMEGDATEMTLYPRRKQVGSVCIHASADERALRHYLRGRRLAG